MNSQTIVCKSSNDAWWKCLSYVWWRIVQLEHLSYRCVLCCEGSSWGRKKNSTKAEIIICTNRYMDNCLSDVYFLQNAQDLQSLFIHISQRGHMELNKCILNNPEPFQNTDTSKCAFKNQWQQISAKAYALKTTGWSYYFKINNNHIF